MVLTARYLSDIEGLVDALPPANIYFSATDKVAGRSTAGAGAGEEITCTASARSIMDDASVEAIRTTLGVGTGDSPTFAGLVVSGTGIRSKIEVFLSSAADDDRYVSLVDMKVGAYSIANATPGDSLAHNLIVTHSTQGATVDTLGTLDIVGLDADGGAQTETITPGEGTTVLSTKYYSSITSITGVGWAIDTGGTPDADHIKVGFDTVMKATVDQCKGSFIRLAGVHTLILPAVVVGYSLAVYSTGANAIVVDPDAADRIILGGAAGDAGHKITSPAAAGDFVSLIGESSAGWTVLGKSGTWTMES
jgi:hypothetical protein